MSIHFNNLLPAWLTEHDVDVYAEGLRRSGLFCPVSFYRNLDANWQASRMSEPSLPVISVQVEQ